MDHHQTHPPILVMPELAPGIYTLRGIVILASVTYTARSSPDMTNSAVSNPGVSNPGVSNPGVLLMDEPSEGLAPQIVAEVMTTIRQLKEQGLSIVLVEQNAKLVFGVADDFVILKSGRVAVEATAAELKQSRVDLHRHLSIY